MAGNKFRSKSHKFVGSILHRACVIGRPILGVVPDVAGDFLECVIRGGQVGFEHAGFGALAIEDGLELLGDEDIINELGKNPSGINGTFSASFGDTAVDL